MKSFLQLAQVINLVVCEKFPEIEENVITTHIFSNNNGGCSYGYHSVQSRYSQIGFGRVCVRDYPENCKEYEADIGLCSFCDNGYQLTKVSQYSYAFYCINQTWQMIIYIIAGVIVAIVIGIYIYMTCLRRRRMLRNGQAAHIQLVPAEPQGNYVLHTDTRQLDDFQPRIADTNQLANNEPQVQENQPQPYISNQNAVTNPDFMPYQPPQASNPIPLYQYDINQQAEYNVNNPNIKYQQGNNYQK